ncbi:MAG: c-type cytochrome, partial [Dehalococcoidia bacterium]|nr:c-type cytochrome [Dehalococcoidia bacterium]
MRKWEILGTIGVAAVLLVLPAAVFGYQGYREAQEGPGMGARPASIAAPAGDPVSGYMVFENKCSACHGKNAEGSAVGPDIRNMAIGAQFVYAWILDPSGVTSAATMPKVPLTEKEAADVTAFVMSYRDGTASANIAASQKLAPPAKAAPAVQSAPGAPGGNAVNGKALFTGKTCSACHGQDGHGTAAAPGVVGISGDAVRKQLRTPSGKMPAFGTSQLSDTDMADLIA